MANFAPANATAEPEPEIMAQLVADAGEDGKQFGHENLSAIFLCRLAVLKYASTC